MENNYILIGLIILTIACIYLFYNNFQKNKEYQLLVEKLGELKMENDNNRQYLVSLQEQTNKNNLMGNNLHPLPNQHQNPNCDEDNLSKIKVNVIDLNREMMKEDDGNNILSQLDDNGNLVQNDLDTNNVNINDNSEKIEELDLNLDEEELKEINNLSNNEEINIADDVASVVESVLLEPEVDLSAIENNDNIELNIDENTNENESNIDDINQNDSNIDNNTDNDTDNFLNLSNQNLDNMNLKELRLMCKNLQLKTKGNKDDLIVRINQKILELNTHETANN